MTKEHFASQRWIGVVLAAIAGMALVLMGTAHYGVGYSADSVAYVTTAQSLLSGHGFNCWDGRPYIDWPPLYPTVLAGMFALVPDPNDAVRWLNAFTFAAIILTAAFLFRSAFQRRLSFWIFLCATVSSFPLLTIHAMIFSEPLFVLLVLLFLMTMIRWLRQESRLTLVFLIVITALATMQRIAGVAVAVTGIAAILFASSRASRWGRIGMAAIYGGLSLVPLGLWTLRNMSVQATMAGNRTLSPVSPLPFIGEVVDGSSAWLLPRPWPVILRAALWVILAALVVWLTIRRSETREKPDRDSKRIWNMMLLWTVIYCGFMVAVSTLTTTRAEALDIRLISPVYVSFVYLFVRAIERFFLILSERSYLGIRSRHVLIACLSFWLLYPIAISARQISLWQSRGICPYRSTRWMQSETLKWVKEHPLTNPVFSDHPEAFYVRQGLEFSLSPMEGDSREAIVKRFHGSPSAYLIWFPDMFWGRNLRPPYDLSRDFDLESVAQLTDGTIYRMSPRKP